MELCIRFSFVKTSEFRGVWLPSVCHCPPIQIHNSKGDITDNDSLRRTSNREKKPLWPKARIFVMRTAYRDWTKILSSSQPSNNNIPKQACASQLYTNLNLYAYQTAPTHRRETANKNGDISNRFRIYHQNIRGLKGKTSELMLHLLTEAPHLICVTEHHLKYFEMDGTPVPKQMVHPSLADGAPIPKQMVHPSLNTNWVQNIAEWNYKMAVFVYTSNKP
jgi:hypothetical protein